MISGGPLTTQLLQYFAHAQQLVLSKHYQAYIVRNVGSPYELYDLRIDRDFPNTFVGKGTKGFMGIRQLGSIR